MLPHEALGEVLALARVDRDLSIPFVSPSFDAVVGVAIPGALL